jgi:isopenicillin-N N-acyltransferase-like protein
VGPPTGRPSAFGIRAYTEERVGLACSGSWAGRPATRADVLGLAERMLPAHRAYDPDVTAELEAMAAAACISAAEAIIVGGFTDFVDAVRAMGTAPQDDGCTSILAPDGAEPGYYAQTWDMHDTATEHVVLLDLRPADGPAALLFTTVGCVAQIGMNEAGIVVGIDNLTMLDGAVGVTWPHVVRRALACATLEAAIDAVRTAPLAGGHAYLIRDAHGGGAMIEASGSGSAVTRLAGAPLVHTNHVLDDRLRTWEASRSAELVGSSVERLATAQRMLAALEERVDLPGLEALLREPAYICRRSRAPYHVESSGAVICRPDTRELWAVWGIPADRPFQRFVVDRHG